MAQAGRADGDRPERMEAFLQQGTHDAAPMAGTLAQLEGLVA